MQVELLDNLPIKPLKKITDLTETRWRTIHPRDAYGRLYRDREEYTAKRRVRSVAMGPRIAHFFVDAIAFQTTIYIVQYLFEMLSNATRFSISLNLTIGLGISIFALLGYSALYTLCEHKWQRTPGKFLTKTLVIDEYGNKPALRAIILRSLIRLIPFEAFSCITDDYSRGWHDSWSDTWVVTEEELFKLKKLQAEE